MSGTMPNTDSHRAPENAPGTSPISGNSAVNKTDTDPCPGGDRMLATSNGRQANRIVN